MTACGQIATTRGGLTDLPLCLAECTYKYVCYFVHFAKQKAFRFLCYLWRNTCLKWFYPLIPVKKPLPRAALLLNCSAASAVAPRTAFGQTKAIEGAAHLPEPPPDRPPSSRPSSAQVRKPSKLGWSSCQQTRKPSTCG